jgi:hypothetical protein
MDSNVNLNIIDAKFTIDLLAPCGLFCGVCPQFLKTPKKCGGCNSKQGFSKYERKMCGIMKCCNGLHIERCNECEIFEMCERLASFTSWDSFISHAVAIENLKKLNQIGNKGFEIHIEQQTKDGMYPPRPIQKSMTIKKLWKMAKPPFKPSKSH